MRIICSQNFRRNIVSNRARIALSEAFDKNRIVLRRAHPRDLVSVHLSKDKVCIVTDVNFAIFNSLQTFFER